MKIYTGTGDSGETGLYGGKRVRKDDVRVESYGVIDEANAALGIANSYISDNELQGLVARLQSDLFIVGGDLASPCQKSEREAGSIVPRIEQNHVRTLELLIDRYEAELTPLTNFILPGGSLGAAHLHLARTILRRGERCVVTLMDADGEHTNPMVIPYLNRLADLLFVLARVVNHRAGVADIPWSRLDTE